MIFILLENLFLNINLKNLVFQLILFFQDFFIQKIYKKIFLIQKIVRFRIANVSFEGQLGSGNLTIIGTIKEDYLGLTN